MSPAGRKFTQAIARELAQQEHLLLVCGSYEGFDERIRGHLAHDELSIGDYVLTNGALPAMVIIDAVTRLLPGVLGDDESSREESFSGAQLEYPHYTRPAEFRALGRCRKCCFRAITRQSPSGGRKKPGGGRRTAGRIY